jgi:branched-chain amino acid transport system substrate-binding protein
MLKYRNWFKIVVLLTVGAILAGGCSSSASTTSSKSSSSKTPIVLGLTSSETGAFAVDATYALDGYKYAVAQVNAHGGWLGHKLVLKIYNDNSSAGTVVSLYTKLITQDHVNFLLGPYSSDITQAIAPLVNK